jgi:hypothetical protein
LPKKQNNAVTNSTDPTILKTIRNEIVKMGSDACRMPALPKLLMNLETAVIANNIPAEQMKDLTSLRWVFILSIQKTNTRTNNKFLVRVSVLAIQLILPFTTTITRRV